ncbi:hypothetical protein [Tenacibaculum ascidiaceicola]|uniref:hypothetical protein n=1 Tax=Tenacibaculum ascidiaceicola TaxID=1699411 RepID=UPI003893A0AA
MKNIVFIIWLIITSFNAYSQQLEFEKELGKENVETLNLLLEDFETNTLKKEYPNITIEEAYKEFLKAITKENYSVLQKNKKVFKENDFKLRIYCVPDSTWIEKREHLSGRKGFVIKERYKHLTLNDKIDYTTSTIFCCENKDKTQQLAKKERVQINFSGLYIKALKNISNKSGFIKYYLEHIEAFGERVNPYTISDYILNNKIDTKNYLVRRILFINNVYR